MTAQAQQESGETSGLRVILVGGAALDAALRRDPGIELVRSRCAMDALGELADPIDADSPARTAVIIADTSCAEHETAELVSALRMIDPGVCVLAVAERNELNGAATPFDALVCADTDGPGLRELLGSLKRRRPPADPAPSAGPDPANDAPAPGPSPALAEGDSEVAILAALLAGTDPLGPCLAVIRARLGAPDAEFIAEGDPAATAAPGPGRAPVSRRGRAFGRLESRTAAPDALARSATWLAHWLALSEQQRQLREAAFTDALTGAWNRRHFDRALPLAIEKARARRHDLTLLLFDIDDFKVYNDQFGHGAGDEILRESVRLMKSVIRPADRVFRIGGDEFAVVFDDPDGPRSQASRRPLEIREIAARFQKQICEHRFPKLGAEAPSTLTISGGLATFPWDAHSAEALIERADQLALESKRQGKNVITFGPGAERACGAEAEEPFPG